MQANNILSVNRFGAYFKKHMVDNYRLYLMSLIVLTGVIVFSLLFVLITEVHIDRYSELVPFYSIGMCAAGLIFTSKSFDELSSKPRGIDYLLLPASHLEKFLTTLLITTIGFLIVYHAAFLLAFKIGEGVLKMRSGITMINDLGSSYTTGNTWMWYWSIYVFIITQSIFLLVTTYFQKYSLLKTLLTFIIFVGCMYLVNAVLLQFFLHKYIKDWRAQFPFIGVNVYKPSAAPALWGSYMDYVLLYLPKRIWMPLLFIAKYLLPLFIWTVAYFKLRDKEI